MVAIDARAPLYDGGICTRVDCVSLGIMVNRDGAALLRRGRGLLAQALRDLGPAGGAAARAGGAFIIDAKAAGRFMPPVFPGVQADTLPALARQLGLPRAASWRTVAHFNAACGGGQFDHAVLDDCPPHGLPRPRRTGRARSTRRRSTATRSSPE
jgi:tricarballylate dehydrogenase